MKWFDLSKREVIWCLYDVGNSAFYTTIVAGFFPVFFKQYWNQGVDPTQSTYYLSLVSSVASLVVAVSAPFCGAFVDAFGRVRLGLILLTGGGVVCCIMLAFCGADQRALAMWVFGGASVGAALAVALYDSLLIEFSSRNRFHKVSLWGYALGYLGGGLLLGVNILMTLKPELFGVADAATAVKISFVLVGLWWLGFSLPLLSCKFGQSSHVAHQMSPRQVCEKTLRSLGKTATQLAAYKPIIWFLVAYWFYIDGVGTVMRMAVDYGLSLNLASSHLMVALLLVQFLGFPFTLAFMRLARKWGSKTGLYIGIGIYMLITLGAPFITSVTHFYILAGGVALAQGGLQALSRSTFAQMIPAEKSAEFFGFYNTIGKFAAIMGPMMLGWVAALTGDSRLSILTILILFVCGAICLSFVRSPDGVSGTEDVNSDG